MTLSRRDLVRGGAALAGGVLASGWSPSRGPQDLPRWGWHLDADGDGRLTDADVAIVRAAIGALRGRDLEPLPDWDPRADVAGTGAIDARHLAAFEALSLPHELPPRPFVAAFHYGWYRGARSRGSRVTVRYRGGPYVSSGRTTEEEFNRTKHEFGISADLLSWIDRPGIRRAYERGYLAARNGGLRRFGLLYETVINLGGDDARISFAAGTDTAERLAASFRAMGEWWARSLDTSGAAPWLVDGRPVVYLFASHLFGPSDAELPRVGEAIVGARRAFREAFGSPPFLIGEESPFPPDRGVGFDRTQRARWLDAVTRYHHYDERQARELAPGGRWRLDAEHRARLVANENRAIAGFRGVRNEFTGEPVLVVPSSAAGFAKREMPTLTASEDDYLAHLQDMQALTDRHLANDHRGHRAADRPPIVIVGSWNEEYEGHALMPASRNEALVGGDRGGFEWLWAIRRLYGWNHHAG